MTTDCEFCRDEFEDTVLKDYRHWVVQIYMDQSLPGRMLIKLKEHKVDVTDLTSIERGEIFEKIVPELKQVLDNMFEPDLYNYASLGNDCRHIHFRLIPRYRSSIEFEGTEFVDDGWDSHYKNVENIEVSEATFERMKSELKSRLKEAGAR